MRKFWSKTKTCRACGLEKNVSNFEKQTSHNCNECKSALKKTQKQKAKNRRSDPKAKIRSLRSQRNNRSKKIDIHKKPCIICGWFDFMAGIDFHHVHPAEKSHTVSGMLKFGPAYIKEEIDKCVCLCSNCHRGVHSGDIDLEKYINVEDYHIKQCSVRPETSNTR